MGENADGINLFSAIAPFMRRNLNRSGEFWENIVPLYSLDEFRNHFRMTRGTMESLCRVIGATGRIPQQQAFGRTPIPLNKQVSAFVWFISNTEVIRSVSDRFEVTLSSLERIIHRVSSALVDVRRQYIKWPSKFRYSNSLPSSLESNLCNINVYIPCSCYSYIGILKSK